MDRSLARWLVVSAAVWISTISSAIAQLPARGGQDPNQIPTVIDLIETEDFRAELQLGTTQLTDLHQVRERTRENIRKALAEMEGLTIKERRERLAEYQERIRSIRGEADTEVARILSPQQAARLKQLLLQLRVMRTGVAGVLADNEIANQLAVTDQQRAQMRTIQQELQKQLEEQVRVLRNKSSELMLEVLSPEQRTQWNVMVGAPMGRSVPTFQPSDADR